MVRYSLFPGCKVPYYLPQYETSSRLVLKQFGVEMEDREFNCCGHPIRFLDFKAFVFSSARNIAIAGQKGLPLLCLCQCCYGALRYADFLVKKHAELRKEVQDFLISEGLRYPDGLEIKHLLHVFADDILPENIRKKMVRSLENLKIAAHYGCHILRPRDVVQFDHPFNPTKFEKLIEATGAKSVDWSRRTQCCGESLWEKNNDLSRELTAKKIRNAREFGAEMLCVSCTHCQMQFDRVGEVLKEEGGTRGLPALLFPQLLGLSLGINGETLGITRQVLDLIESKPSP